MRNDRSAGTTRIDPSELAAILAEVRSAILAVDADTGEHPRLRNLNLTFAPPAEADTKRPVVGS